MGATSDEFTPPPHGGTIVNCSIVSATGSAHVPGAKVANLRVLRLRAQIRRRTLQRRPDFFLERFDSRLPPLTLQASVSEDSDM
jgi:hypothetical protein